MTTVFATRACDLSDKTELPSSESVVARPPYKFPDLTEAEIENFHCSYCRGPDNDCWIWRARSSGPYPYGYFTVGRKSIGAHRIAFRLNGGEVDSTKPWVLHSCHTTLCVNPHHLRAGTPRENTDDMLLAGRQASGDRQGARLHPETLRRGEENHSSKLNDEAVLKIRALGNVASSEQKELARQYGVSESAIYFVVAGRSWKHLL